MDRRSYRWLYDRILCRIYDLYLGWFLLPYGGERRFRWAMLEGLAFRRGERILDATCGTGGCTAAVRERARDSVLVASDLSLGQVRMAFRKPSLEGVRFAVADASHLPFAPGAFDTVFIPHALHEMPHPLRLAVLREARRVAGPEGRVVVLELDRPPRRALRLLMGLWFLYWVPHPINFESRPRRDLERRGLTQEIAEAGFARVHKRSKFAGTMQVVEAWGTPATSG
jgi:ubiquinone/menaquinone biosynthesis C-methylase UbiE